MREAGLLSRGELPEYLAKAVRKLEDDQTPGTSRRVVGILILFEDADSASEKHDKASLTERFRLDRLLTEDSDWESRPIAPEADDDLYSGF